MLSHVSFFLAFAYSSNRLLFSGYSSTLAHSNYALLFIVWLCCNIFFFSLLIQIVKQIRCVNEVYRLHNLPEFYKDPRPHISVAWALGDVSDSLKIAIEEEMKRSIMGSSSQKFIFSCKFSGIECKIGNKLYKICKNLDE
uniref:U6 snRNA phosphodiesterase 1 n=1 Tax=Rhizophora mucronata TaxID=61149 RepID=A0A2P2K042_RHIMU